MQTAFSITNVSFSADPVAPNVVDLVVDFQIHNNGPSHVAGLIVTTDFWITSHIAPAAFQSFGTGFKIWRSVFQTPGPPVTYEFVIFYDDFGGIDTVPNQQVPSPPLVAIDEGRLDDMVGKRGDQRFGFRASIPSIPVQSSRVT